MNSEHFAKLISENDNAFSASGSFHSMEREHGDMKDKVYVELLTTDPIKNFPYLYYAHKTKVFDILLNKVMPDPSNNDAIKKFLEHGTTKGHTYITTSICEIVLKVVMEAKIKMVYEEDRWNGKSDFVRKRVCEKLEIYWEKLTNWKDNIAFLLCDTVVKYIQMLSEDDAIDRSILDRKISHLENTFISEGRGGNTGAIFLLYIYYKFKNLKEKKELTLISMIECIIKCAKNVSKPYGYYGDPELAFRKTMLIGLLDYMDEWFTVTEEDLKKISEIFEENSIEERDVINKFFKIKMKFRVNSCEGNLEKLQKLFEEYIKSYFRIDDPLLEKFLEAGVVLNSESINYLIQCSYRTMIALHKKGFKLNVENVNLGTVRDFTNYGTHRDDAYIEGFKILMDCGLKLDNETINHFLTPDRETMKIVSDKCSFTMRDIEVTRARYILTTPESFRVFEEISKEKDWDNCFSEEMLNESLETFIESNAGDLNYSLNYNHILKLSELGASLEPYELKLLTIAIKKNDLVMMEELVKAGVNLEVDEGEPLVICVKEGNLEMVKLILKLGAIVHTDDEELLIMALKSNDILHRFLKRRYFMKKDLKKELKNE